MRWLISAVILFFLYVSTIVASVYNFKYAVPFNFVLIAVVSALLFVPIIHAFILYLIALFLPLGFLIVGESIADVSLMIGSVIFVGMAAYSLRYFTDRIYKKKIEGLEEIKRIHREAFARKQEAKNEKEFLEKKVYDISSLYKAPKKMTSSVTLEELVDCLRKSLNEHFSFSKASLLIFSFKEKEPVIDSVVHFHDEETEDKAVITESMEPLVEMMRDRQDPLIVDNASQMAAPEGIVLSDDVERFIAVSLFSGERINGVLFAENIMMDDVIRFIILARQFSMVLERIRLHQLVQELAITDGLTAVFVRRHFNQRFNEELERAKEFNTKVSFLMIDIDFFKKCNDQYGHLVGDAVLRNTSQVLKKNLREIDLIGRYGGEEFSIILPETGKEPAKVAGERLRSAVEKSIVNAYNESLNVTISVGVATFPDDTSEASNLIDKADQMLYKAKENGRNRVMVYE
ncbi:MAG: diguanylate cyclase [Candidatus Omnitrophota bacterium]